MINEPHFRKMRTTVNIQEAALALCRKKAAESGKSLGEVISEAVLQAYRTRPSVPNRRRFHLPTSWKGGLQPGVDLDDSAALQDIMDRLR